MTNQDAIAAVKRNPIGFLCGALSVAFAVTLYVRDEEIPGAEAEMALRTADRDRVALNIKYSVQLTEQSDALNTSVKEIESRLIRPSELGTNTQYFYTLEKLTGVKITDLRQSTFSAIGAVTSGAVAARASKGTFSPVGFSIGAQGTLPQILDFLRHLENGSHYCRVLTSSFVGNPSSRNPIITVSLNLELLGQQ
jgi:hypothetical protein